MGYRAQGHWLIGIRKWREASLDGLNLKRDIHLFLFSSREKQWNLDIFRLFSVFYSCYFYSMKSVILSSGFGWCFREISYSCLPGTIPHPGKPLSPGQTKTAGHPGSRGFSLLLRWLQIASQPVLSFHSYLAPLLLNSFRNPALIGPLLIIYNTIEQTSQTGRKLCLQS